MKKIFALIACMMLLTACDDGELTFSTFNFDGDPDPCDFAENTYINVNDNEVLILKFADDDLLNIEGEDTITFAEGDIEYRVYNATGLSTSNVCGSLDNASLSVRESWDGSGTATITTTKTIDETTGEVVYYHSINLIDVSFTKGEQTIRIQDTYVGQIKKPIGFYFDFAENLEDSNRFSECNSEKYFLNNTNTTDEVILLNIPTTSIPTTTGITNPPITLDPNGVYFRFIKYSSSGLDDDIICDGNVLSPVPEQIWFTQSGQLIIDTQEVDGELVHIMYLKNAVFYNTLGTGETFEPVGNISDPTGGSEDVYYIGRFIY
ncbi:hypothetical protein ACLI1A_05265 [Flavobacterium sp. RHBU_3]|uniref:hypothetical protein n=1 Tax=Flavobacterium sp. RHBU_3 TaxID=3391184 RepID=UPI003984FAD5